MTLSKLLSDKRIQKLPAASLKIYLYLLGESKNGTIECFTIRGLCRKAKEKEELNLPTGKNTIKESLRELEINKLIINDQDKNSLTILEI